MSSNGWHGDPTKTLGLQDASDATLETLKAIEYPISRQAQILVEVCSFAATGNVLRIQKLLHLCGEHLEAMKEREEVLKDDKKDEKKDEKKEEVPKPDDTFLSFAVLGISIIAMGEEIGSEMSMRQFNHLVSLNNLLCDTDSQTMADALW